MQSILKQLEAALIAAGYRKKDGSLNTYAVEKDGIVDSGSLAKWRRGSGMSVAVLVRICDAIGYEVHLRPGLLSPEVLQKLSKSRKTGNPVKKSP